MVALRLAQGDGAGQVEVVFDFKRQDKGGIGRVPYGDTTVVNIGVRAFIEPAHLDYRPTPKQRSTGELVKYLSMMGPVVVEAGIAGKFDEAAWTAAETEAMAGTLEAAAARIATHATRRSMMEYALANGFVTMQQDGIAKVLAGEITLEELISTIDLTDRL
mgnify:CR=1 FL=1